MHIAVTRIGALFHYAIPRALVRLGALERFYTDLWADHFPLTGLCHWPGSQRSVRIRKLCERCHPEIPPERVTSLPSVGLEYQYRLWRARTVDDYLAAHLWAGSAFARRIARRGVDGAQAVYTTNSQGLELLEHARRQGLATIMEQTIAPYDYERRLLAAEYDRYPAWMSEPPAASSPAEAFGRRERAEWEACDVILCGSAFVREAIRAVGGPHEKCRVVPYAYETSGTGTVDVRSRPHCPLRVLTVGTVSLRKGFPYLSAAATAMRDRVHWRVVGAMAVPRAAQRDLAESVDWIGSIPRSAVAEQYRWADVFVLPSLCEGSATVCYEALYHGLPVVCTPNTGSVVEDGCNGLLVPIRDSEALTGALERLIREAGLLEALSRGALASRASFAMAAYTQRLAATLTDVMPEWQ